MKYQENIILCMCVHANNFFEIFNQEDIHENIQVIFLTSIV